MVQHRGFANTKPTGRADFMKNIFKHGALFLLVIAIVKTRPVLKRAWPWLSNEGSTQWE